MGLLYHTYPIQDIVIFAVDVAKVFANTFLVFDFERVKVRQILFFPLCNGRDFNTL
jgi:hypothetical protein